MINLTLASGHVTPDAPIKIELLDTGIVVIVWPTRPTPVSPKRYDEIASRAMRILANASTQLARRRAAGP